MLYAVRGNKQLKIDDSEKETYLKLGYDIAKETANELEVIQVSPSSTVAYAKYKALKDENEELKGRLETVDKLQADFDKAKAENKELKAKVKELEKPETK